MFQSSPLKQLLIFFVILLTISACRTVPVRAPGVHVSAGHNSPPAHAPAHGRRAQYRYYYYPDVEVYFDLRRRSYFYLSNGHWKLSATLPDTLRLRLGTHVSLELETDTPYRYHRQHRKFYPPGYFKKKHKKHKKHNKGRGQGHGYDD